MQPVIDYAKSLGVKVALENLCTFPDHIEKFYPQTSFDLKKLINALGENVCAVWDFGHAHLNGNNQVKDVLYLGEKLKATHVHSNRLEQDTHALPLSGTTEWKGVMSAMKKIDYSEYLTLEINYSVDTVTKEFIETAYNQVVSLYEMLKKGE